MTKTKTKIGILSVVSATLLLAVIMPSIPFAMADKPTVCVGLLPAGTYGNVIAPGPACVTALGVIIDGDLKQTGGTLDLTNDAHVTGSVKVDGAIWTSLWFVTVDGDVKISNLSGPDLTQVAITGSIIGGDVKIKNNNIDRIVMGILAGGPAPNVIGGDLKISNNIISGFVGDAGVAHNIINGDYKCEENSGVGLSTIVDNVSTNTVAGKTKCV